MRPAVFLDRDGTLIEHVHHLADWRDVRLLDGSAEAIRNLRAAGFACVVVTNQSVVGRGKLTIKGLQEIHEVMDVSLAERGARLDGIYSCPVVPLETDPEVIEHPDRKPGPGMLRRAAADLTLDLARSWMIGDTISDLLAGRNARCGRTVLVRTGCGHGVDSEHSAIDYVVGDLPAAAALILNTHDNEARHDRREVC
ncbi:MAG: HAD family hydrolase [bacterium]|nr:HAD family hydrolase [bacterium]